MVALLSGRLSSWFCNNYRHNGDPCRSRVRNEQKNIKDHWKKHHTPDSAYQRVRKLRLGVQMIVLNDLNDLNEMNDLNETNDLNEMNDTKKMNDVAGYHVELQYMCSC